VESLLPSLSIRRFFLKPIPMVCASPFSLSFECVTIFASLLLI
jgi:hypothetical protein